MKRLIDFFRSVTPRRWVIYLTGIVILACGITMSSKTNLGTSPVISVAYNISDLTGIPFGVMTFIYYVFLIAVQVLLLRREFDPVQCFQLLASFLTSTFIGLFDRFLPSSEVFPVQVLLLILAIVLTGIGIILTVGAQFVPNPADGLASLISPRCRKSLGLRQKSAGFCEHSDFSRPRAPVPRQNLRHRDRHGDHHAVNRPRCGDPAEAGPAARRDHAGSLISKEKRPGLRGVLLRLFPETAIRSMCKPITKRHQIIWCRFSVFEQLRRIIQVCTAVPSLLADGGASRLTGASTASAFLPNDYLLYSLSPFQRISTKTG